MARGIIDRFEDDMAIIEVGDRLISINKNLLPSNAKEGDVIDLKTRKIDHNETQHRSNKIKRLMRDIWEEND